MLPSCSTHYLTDERKEGVLMKHLKHASFCFLLFLVFQAISCGTQRMIAVTVMDANQKVPVGDAHIKVISANSKKIVVEKDTGLDGKQLFEDLKPDKYQVSVQKKYVSSERDSDIYDLITQKKEDITLELPITLAAIEGVVNDFQGNPISQAFIEVKDAQQLIKSDYTDSKGKFLIPYLSPGSFRIEISHPNYLTKQETIELEQGQVKPIGEVKLTKIKEIRQTSPSGPKPPPQPIPGKGGGKS
jgi:hypothetical protein